MSAGKTDAQRNIFQRFFSVLGPGLITGAADDDPSSASIRSKRRQAGFFVSLFVSRHV
jgi:Mn2+/Fe2+ NRAMP family transporter